MRTQRLVQGLSIAFEVILITLTDDRDRDEPAAAALACELGVEVLLAPTDERAPTRPGGPLMAPFHSVALQARLAELVAERGVDLIQYECAQPAQNGPVAGALNVLDAHNVEYVVPQQLAASCGSGADAHDRDWRRLRRAEHAIWQRMDLCLAVSDLDAGLMRKAGARRVVCCPNGADVIPPLAPPTVDGDTPLRLLFVARADYEPNGRGLDWLARAVLPRLRLRHPTHLRVIGRTGDHPPVAADVEYLGEVATVREHYAWSEAVVVPIFEGSGTRLKVLEAIGHGRPLVSTSRGVEGLPLRSPEHFLRADDPGAFAAAIHRLTTGLRARDPQLTPMISAAREAVAELSWPRIAGDLVELYRQELEVPDVSAPAESRC